MLKTRVMTAAVLLAVFLSALFLLPKDGWIAFCALFLGLSGVGVGALAALVPAGRFIYSAFLVGLFVLPGILEAPVANGWYAPAWVYYAAGLFWIALVPMWIWRQPRFGSRAVLLAAGATALLPPPLRSWICAAFILPSCSPPWQRSGSPTRPRISSAALR